MDSELNVATESECLDKTEKKVKPKNKKSDNEENIDTANKTGDAEDGGPPKNYRKRKRHHYNAIRDQMEFYFGDANLSKDRFLKQLIDKDPFVPLDTFLSFNKLKVLTSSAEEIAKSLSNSKLLELDETQRKVRRKTELPVDRNVDEKTIYVEALPVTADHEWVRQIFERFGPVVYVSLPKYAKTRKIKEFGFVEFEKESSVDKVVKAFQEFNGVLKMQDADPAELQSIKSFVKEQNVEKDDKLIVEVEKNNTKRRRKLDDDQQEDSKPDAKKLKTEERDDTPADTADDMTAGEETEQEDKSEPLKEDDPNKKRRKKKKKSRNEEKQKKNSDLNNDASFYELKVLPKRDWKRLRNKYLNMQREKIGELKRKLWKEKQQQQQQDAEGAGTERLDVTAPPPAKTQKHNERKLRKMNMNFYGAGEDEPKNQVKETKHNPALERPPLFTYAKGLIVEVGFMEPCVNVKEFKADMRQYEAVKYVDVKEGVMHANLRLETAEAAIEFVRKVSCAEYNCKILTGDAENEYWKKIEQDREMKLNKQVKGPQKRGREKVKKLVTKHIRFGDDDEQ